MEMFVFIVSILLVIEASDVNDPCLPVNHKELDKWERSTGNHYVNANASICDNFLPSGWYRPNSPVGNKMPTECLPNGFRCGTTSPIWMNGTYPPDGQTSNVTACVSRYDGSCCSNSYKIQVKNCGSYYVYNLTNTNGCYQAYCFGNESKCPAGQTSDNGGFTPGCEFDPCHESNYNILKDEVKRSASYSTKSSDFAIEDSRLPSGWYRVDSPAGNDIVTYPVPMLHCGTVFPLWMNGTLPSISDKTINRTVCRSDLNGSCEHRYDIQVKNCGSYRTYHLSQLNVDKAAYCFGNESKCPVGQTSENSGYTPGCEFDPCHESNYKVLRGEVRRSASYKTLTTDTPIEDSRLDTNWYRIYSETGNDIVVYGVAMRHCGTVFPLWMNGTLPSISDKTVYRTVCRSGIYGICEQQYDIQVRNCGNYRTYYLTRLNMDKSAYCFGTQPVPTTSTRSTPRPPPRPTHPEPQPTRENHDESKGDQQRKAGWTVFIIVGLLALMCTVLLLVQIIWCYRKRLNRNQTVCCESDQPAKLEQPPLYHPSTTPHNNVVYYIPPPPYCKTENVDSKTAKQNIEKVTISAVQGRFESATQ